MFCGWSQMHDTSLSQCLAVWAYVLLPNRNFQIAFWVPPSIIIRGFLDLHPTSVHCVIESQHRVVINLSLICSCCFNTDLTCSFVLTLLHLQLNISMSKGFWLLSLLTRCQVFLHGLGLS